MKIWSVLSLAIEKYGIEHQKKKAVEEMGELITALAREQDGRATPDQVITEIADVQILMRQLATVYGEQAVQKEIERKIRRLSRRMANQFGTLKKQ